MIISGIKLSELNENEIGYITELEAQGDIRRRLLDLGMIEGTRVECLFKSPHGDPTAYGVRGAVIALRKEDSDTIMIDMY